METPYQFTYNLGSNSIEDFVPPIFFHARDPWGYYNGTNCNVPIDGFVDKSTTPISDWRKLAIYSNRHYINNKEEFFSNIKINLAANGLLKSYRTPEGQTVEYEYEQNQADFSEFMRSVGGVHVSKVISYSLSDDRRHIYEYSYKMPDGKSSLWGVELPRSVSKITRHYVAEKDPGLSPYKYRYLLDYQGIDLSEEASKYLIIHRSLSILKTMASFVRNPSPLNLIYQIGKVIIEVIDLYTNKNEQTKVQYYFHREPLNFSNPLPAQFKRVIVNDKAFEDGILKGNGRVEYEFTSDSDFPLILPTLWPGDSGFNPHFFSQSQRSYQWMYGLLKKVRTFRNNENTPLREVEYTYGNIIALDSHNDITMTTCNCEPVYFDSKRENEFTLLTSDIDNNFTNSTIPDKLYVDFIYVYTGFPALLEVKQHNYMGGAVITETSTYTYNNRGLVSSHKTFDSKGRENETKTYYHDDFYQYNVRPSNVFTYLYDENRGNIPIAIENWRTNKPGRAKKLIASQVFEYAPLTNGDIKLITDYVYESEVPIDINALGAFSQTTPPILQRDPNYFKQNSQITYDQKGVAVQFKNSKHNTINSYIFDYDHQYPIAKILNAGTDEVAYTSFETEEKNNWQYDLAQISESSIAVTGNKCFNLDLEYNKAIRLNQSMPSFTNKPYILSFWANVQSVIINGTMTSSLENKSINGWYFFKIDFGIGTAPPIIQGNGKIDELRWFPQDSRMETYAYDLFGNQIALCDINNHIAYYEYDGLNRLTLVRDQEENILKKYCYTLSGQQEDCTGFYKSARKSSLFSKDNCPAGYFAGAAVKYVVEEGKYTSGINQEEADAQAEADILFNGQAYANTHGKCLPYAPFTKLTIENQYGNVADIVLRFYADQACTIPYSINNLNVLVQVEKYNDVTGISIYDNYNIECEGDMVVAFPSVLLIKQLNDSYHSSEYSFFSLIPDPSYTIVYH